MIIACKHDCGECDLSNTCEHSTELLVCDVCGEKIPLNRETKCPTCDLVVCSCCVDCCKECGDMLCCNSGEFNGDLCKSCEEKYYIDFVEV